MVEKLFLNFTGFALSDVCLPLKCDFRQPYVEFLTPDNQLLSVQCGRLPVDFFYTHNSLNFLVFFSTSLVSRWTFLLVLSNSLFIWFFLQSQSLLTSQFCFFYNLTNYKNFFLYSFSTLFNGLRFLILLDTTLMIPTLSSFIPGSIWFEREISELSNVYFIGLQDSRKLLFDYSLSTLEASVTTNLVSWDWTFNNLLYLV